MSASQLISDIGNIYAVLQSSNGQIDTTPVVNTLLSSLSVLNQPTPSAAFADIFEAPSAQLINPLNATIVSSLEFHRVILQICWR